MNLHQTSYGEGRRIWRGAHPVLWVAIFGALIAFAWEMLQLPFYGTGELSPAEVAYRCGLASFGDSGIMVASYLGASLGNGRTPWIVEWPISRFLVYLGIGLAITSIVEILAENDQCGSDAPLWCSRWFWVAATSAFLFLLSYLQLRHQIRICVLGAICFLVGMALTIALDLTEITWTNFSKFNDILYYGESLNSLAGILFISFFVHNVVLPIVKSQRNPRPSDLAVSYTAVGITYVLVGCFGALAYHEKDEGGPKEPRRYPVTGTCRDVAMILHAVTFYPLMTVIYRQQVIGGLLRPQSSNGSQSDIIAAASGSPLNRGFQNGGGRPDLRAPAGIGPGSGGDAADSAGGYGADHAKARSERLCGYAQTFVVTLAMVGFSGGVTGAYPELDKE